MNIAVLGTGIMGTAIARNLLRAGLDVTVWNRGEFPTSFPLRHAHKDAGLVAQEAEQRALDLPAIRAALAQLDRALELGLGDQDVAAVNEAVRPGVEPPA
jgi:3-hydroxyisobutyrate dehydrogenase